MQNSTPLEVFFKDILYITKISRFTIRKGYEFLAFLTEIKSLNNKSVLRISISFVIKKLLTICRLYCRPYYVVVGEIFETDGIMDLLGQPVQHWNLVLDLSFICHSVTSSIGI